MTPAQPTGRRRTPLGSSRAPAAKKATRKAPASAKPRRYSTGALNDFPAKLPRERFEVIVDVGANAGQTTRELVDAYPHAAVWAIEPIAASYKALVAATEDSAGVTPVRIGLSAREGSGVMRSDGTSPGNKLLANDTASKGREKVKLATGDAFCDEHGIDHIGFLKVDTVGHDLDVLRGFHGMLGREAVDIVQVEAAMFRNTARVPLERLRGYLDPLGYQVFGIYSQARGHAGMPVLTRMDVVFISAPTIERNTAAK